MQCLERIAGRIQQEPDWKEIFRNQHRRRLEIRRGQVLIHDRNLAKIATNIVAKAINDIAPDMEVAPQYRWDAVLAYCFEGILLCQIKLGLGGEREVPAKKIASLERQLNPHLYKRRIICPSQEPEEGDWLFYTTKDVFRADIRRTLLAKGYRTKG